MSAKKYENDVSRITGLLILEVRKSNPNGDPERESSPASGPMGKAKSPCLREAKTPRPRS